MHKLLLVDDDIEITTLLKEILELEQFEVIIAHDGREALEKFDDSFDLVLLDIMMPNIDGIAVLSHLRKTNTTPVILVTAKDNEIDKVIGLEFGADDYVVKPFNDRELIARIRATLRRSSWEVKKIESKVPEKREFFIDNLKVNANQQAAYYKSQYLDLTNAEFTILYSLIQNKGESISREKLAELLGGDLSPDTRSVDVHVSKLRKKLPERGNGLPWIKTLRSQGYMFVMNEK